MKKFLSLFIFSFLFLPLLCLAEQININSATLSELDKLTGIGPIYAQRIIDGRPYSSVDDLDKVKGIGPATLQKIKAQGWACVNCGTTESTATAENLEAVNNAVPKETPALEPILYPTGVYINEIMPNPQGDDSLDEWVELYNSNNTEIYLSGWQIKDLAGTATTFTISKDTKISANGYLVFKRPETKIMLNNEEDGLVLLSPDGKTQDQVQFSKAPLGQSYCKKDSSWVWSTSLTPGAINIITAAAKVLPKSKKSANNNVIQAQDLTAELNQTDPKEAKKSNYGASPWFLFFVVLITAVILAIFVLIYKIKFLNKTNVRT